MKNSNNNAYNKVDRKFEKQVSHLSGFIGMPMWNGRNPSLSEIREFDRRILEQQVKAFKPKRKSVLNQLFKEVVTSLSKTFKQVGATKRRTKNTTSERKEPVTTGAEYCG